MKSQIHYSSLSRAQSLARRILSGVGSALLCALAVSLTGCSSTRSKSKPENEVVHQRGWIGGEFRLARKPTACDVLFGSEDDYIASLPHGLASSNRAGILITALGANTPARQAGLRDGDLILACNRQSVSTVKAFLQLIDRTEPGTSLPISAWRDGNTFECNVPVGRETFKNWGVFCVGFALPRLPELGPRDLLPSPGFNLIALGFEPTPDDRQELGSPESAYLRACNHGKYTPSDRDWHAWLAIFSVAKGKNILSQESVPASPEK